MTACGDALRVLQVTTDDDRRGGQVFATDLAAGLEQLGHDVRTVGLAPGLVGGLDLETLGPRRRHPLTIARLRETIRGADVVVGHGSTTLPACAVACAGTGVPFVYRQISDSLFWANTPGRRRRVRWALSKATRVVALWQGAATTLVEHFGVRSDRIDCIPNGVRHERFDEITTLDRSRARQILDIPGDDVIVAYTGALVPEKGVDLAVSAVARLDGVVLVIAGDGPERQRLEEMVTELRIPAAFLGSLSDPAPVYAAADVVVLPSRGGDSMPASLIEAGMMGRPVVAADVAAISQVVDDGRTGFVVPADDVDALTLALRTLCVRADLRGSMGRAAQRRCRRDYSIAVVANQWADSVRRASRDVGPRLRRHRMIANGLD